MSSNIPPLTVPEIVHRLQSLPEHEQRRALDDLRRRDAGLHAAVSDALLDHTVRWAPTFEPGDRVGKFRVIEMLGEGASGSVYRAIDTTHVGDGAFQAREVALKVSRVDTAHDGLNRDLLEKEAHLLRRLRHPRLPVVEALFEFRARRVLVMEYIAGDSLKTRRRARSEPFPVTTVLPWLRATLGVLGYLHTLPARSTAAGGVPVSETPIFHRDIKPDNLILDAHGNLYVVDLGIARSGISDLTAVVSSDVGMGSRGYAAPEVAFRETTLPQSDLYSVGMTAVTLLTPHDARDVPAELRSDALRSGAPDPLHEILERADLPAPLREWIRTATALVPGQRFASAAEMIEALDRVGSPTAASTAAPTPIPAPDRDAPPARRPVLAGLLVAAVVVAVGFGTWTVWPDPPPAPPVAEVSEPAAGPQPLPTPEGEGSAVVSAPAGPAPISPAASVPAPPAASSSPPSSSPPPPVAAPATGTLRATLLGEDGAPLAGARASLVGGATSDVADAVGDIVLTNLPPGVQFVEVQAEGYSARRFRVEVAAGESVSRTLQFDTEDLAVETY